MALPQGLQALVDQITKDLATLQTDVLSLQSPGAMPVPPPSVDTVSPPYGVLQTCLSLFALQWDGKTLDPSDNGQGAWGADTKAVQGCALPIVLLQQTFGGLESSRIHGYTVEVYSLVTQKTVSAVDIVDEGPAAWTHRLLDGTYLLHKALGHIDYGDKMYGPWTPSNKNWPAGFNCAFWINDPTGHAVKISGVDFSKNPAIIIGS